MADHDFAAEDGAGAGGQPESSDAQTLKMAVHSALFTSPEAFLMTIEELNDKEKEVGYWEKEVRSSTWVVIKRVDEVVGVAVARWPDPRDGDPATERYIESVWIDPKLRGQHLAEQLIKFLFEVECDKSPYVGQFSLWVFDKNEYAKRLYKRMGFEYAGQQYARNGCKELRYEYRLELGIGGTSAAASTQLDAPRNSDLIYRVLGKG